MTPEERAVKLVADKRVRADEAEDIARAIHDAVAEEREACAAVADKWESAAIAAAIRVRPLTASPPRRSRTPACALPD